VAREHPRCQGRLWRWLAEPRAGGSAVRLVKDCLFRIKYVRVLESPDFGELRFVAWVGATCARWAHPVSCLDRFHPNAQRRHLSAQRQLARLRWSVPYVRVQGGAGVSEAVTPAAHSAREPGMGEGRATGREWGITCRIDPCFTSSSGYTELRR
jgi:hypothetical protein